MDNFIVSNKPDVIFGSESWVHPSISTSEVFSPEFQVFRKDRKDGRGGEVFLACNRRVFWQEVTLHTSCEVVACKTELNKQDLLYIDHLIVTLII